MSQQSSEEDRELTAEERAELEALQLAMVEVLLREGSSG